MTSKLTLFQKSLENYAQKANPTYQDFDAIIAQIPPFLKFQTTLENFTPHLANPDLALELSDLLLQYPSLTTTFMKQLKSLRYGMPQIYSPLQELLQIIPNLNKELDKAIRDDPAAQKFLDLSNDNLF